MTLQELFRTSNFDQAFAYISKFHPKSANSRFPYTVAYEYLCQIEAKPGIEICFTKRPLYEDDCAPDVNVWCSVLEGINWNEAMGAEVVVSDEITDAPLDMIVGMALWHITFYGFSPDEQHETFENWSRDEEPVHDEPEDEDDILSDATKALYPDMNSMLELPDGEYDRLYDIYSAACLKELTEKAENGDKYAQFFLARIFDEGYYGVEVNPDKAFELYQKSATQGFYRAQNNLGRCYSQGIGTDKNIEKAKEYYELATHSPHTQGVPEENLGFVELDSGNKERALYWFGEAAKKGSISSKPFIWYLERTPKWTSLVSFVQ
jgi:hypothetical protein